ncbi:MAG: DsbA family protein [Chloroflexi bacterium]|nr:DsbA family protein [Chloroflexota bacterium]
MSSVPSQRGRKVAARKRNPLLPYYLAIGAVVVLGAAFLATYLLRNNAARQVTAPNAPVGQTAEGFWYKGNPAAPVTVIEYADYQCPSCAYYDRNMAPIIARDYIDTGKIQFVYHEVPLNSHQHAVAAAEAARCAGDQGQFWQMHDMLYLNQEQWSPLSTVRNVYSGYAGQLGLDRAAFDACMSAGTHTAVVTAAAETAFAAGVTGTPTFSVNGQLVDMRGLPGAIEAALRAAGQ